MGENSHLIFRTQIGTHDCDMSTKCMTYYLRTDVFSVMLRL